MPVNRMARLQVPVCSMRRIGPWQWNRGGQIVRVTRRTGSIGPRDGAVDDRAKVGARRQQAKRAGWLVTKTRSAKSVGHRRRRMLEEERALHGEDEIAHDRARLRLVAPFAPGELVLQSARKRL